MTTQYWIYQKNIYSWRNLPVQAKLIAPPAKELTVLYGQHGFRSPLQPEPYNVDLRLTYRINSRHIQPDNYFENAGFNLYADQLAHLLDDFGVKAEVFPVRLLDENDTVLTHLPYLVYHVLEGVLNAMDREASGWLDDDSASVARLVLADGAFERRPVFTCAGVYVNLMRDDVRQAILDAGLSGFRWLDPADYRSGQYGLAPQFEE
jgi:hypothetical protein